MSPTPSATSQWVHRSRWDPAGAARLARSGAAGARCFGACRSRRRVLVRAMSGKILPSMKLLVTGGAGFIGVNFIAAWLAGHPTDEIVNVDLLTYAGDRASLADVVRDHGSRYAFVPAGISHAASTF